MVASLDLLALNLAKKDGFQDLAKDQAFFCCHRNPGRPSTEDNGKILKQVNGSDECPV